MPKELGGTYDRIMETNYFQTIVSIRDKLTNAATDITSCSIQKITSMYSNTKTPIYKLVINNKPISRNNSYVVMYKCQTCQTENEITLNLFMRKVNKNITRCEICRNKDEEKCKTQSDFMKENINNIRNGEYIKQTTKIKFNTLEQHLQKSQIDWENEDVNFKEQYFLHHLDNADFTRILPKIVSVGNDKLQMLNDWYYYPTYRIFNQTRFTPMLIHKTEQCTEKPQYIKFRCDNCECMFTHRDLEIVKNKYKLLCQQCSLTNRSFKLRTMKTKRGETILWQSLPEKRFIEWCEEHNIHIKNGPSLDYYFQDKVHKYRVDFELPEKCVLVEIKDNHCWHIEQIKTGKFAAKEHAAVEWCEKNNYKFHVVFPKTIQDFKKSIL